MVRAAERAGAADAPVDQRARHRCHHRNLQRLRRGQIRQDAGQAGRQQRFAGARRADHQQVVAPGGGNLQRALGHFLPLHLLEIRAKPARFRLSLYGQRQHLRALEVVE